MDSFYDAPRRAPIPTQIEKFQAAPLVPEVSIICPLKTPKNENKCMSYETWKSQQNRSEKNVALSSNGQNITDDLHIFNQNRLPGPQNTSQLFKKQVRFESPALQQKPSLTYEPVNPRKVGTLSCDNATIALEPLSKLQQNCPSAAKYAKMYLANIPNKNLDLSLLEMANKSKGKQEMKKQVHSLKLENVEMDKENMLPKTYRELLETRKKIAKDDQDSITDILNYKRRFSDNESGSGNNIFKEYPTLPGSMKVNHVFPSKISEKECFRNNYNDINPQCCTERRQVKPFFPKNQFTSIRNQDFGNVPTNFNISQKHDQITQTSAIYNSPHILEVKEKPTEVLKNGSELSNQDLLKIIAQQNEQLLILQRQVAMLLSRQEKQTPCLHQNTNFVGETYSSTQNEMFRNPMLETTPRKQRPLSKFSIDLMTSFEVAIRSQTNKQNFVNDEPKIQEIAESDSDKEISGADKFDKTIVDTSLHFKEPVKVREVCPSPEPSININMNDYDSSDDEEASASDIGATFYHNLMGQVNDILRKAQVQKDGSKENYNDENKKQCIMTRVREATLRHLHNIGVTIGPIKEEDEDICFNKGSKGHSPMEISFAVKQLLLKYLPDDQLAKITCKRLQSNAANKTTKFGIIPAKPEFSFASVEYMKKYNLVSNLKPKLQGQQLEHLESVKTGQIPKVLDITTLKMQPKLL